LPSTAGGAEGGEGRHDYPAVGYGQSEPNKIQVYRISTLGRMIVGVHIRNEIVLIEIRKPARDIAVSYYSTENILREKPFLRATFAELSQILALNISPAAFAPLIADQCLLLSSLNLAKSVFI